MRQPDRTEVESDGRTIRYQWVLTSEPHTDGEAVGVRECLAELRCTYRVGEGLDAVLHQRDTGRYAQRGYTMVRETIQVGGPGGVRVAREPLSRFSRKRLTAFAEAALATVVERTEGTNMETVFAAATARSWSQRV